MYKYILPFAAHFGVNSKWRKALEIVEQFT